ncbi:purine and uridine phosphorylase [Pterulicium gracile]|uniref:Purine and uridine phosphorylase n=1 Tax=Pterulicium gracile TaxID=1884261 RepID=A0A5C3QJE2_9AGAR|nr:purine and uridine phosphorylase [Pterula gracilis]
MKDKLTDANFPRTVDGRVYHLGIRSGEVANRIITVGSPSRARTISTHLDALPTPFVLSSERGFLTITGRYKGIPVSIVSIGMGHPNMDFFVREVRECVRGDMIVVRIGSCGALADVPVGSVAIPRACVAVMRDFNFEFEEGKEGDSPYLISREAEADGELHEKLKQAIDSVKPTSFTGAIVQGVNASADSFYSSQGRLTSFPDYNEELVERIQREVKDVTTLEMETFHLYHLAKCWTLGRSKSATKQTHIPPVTTSPTEPTTSSPSQGASNASPSGASNISPSGPATPGNTKIRAAAVQMIFAARQSREFISPEEVGALEGWTGKAVLDALGGMEVRTEDLHPEEGSVWALK